MLLLNRPSLRFGQHAGKGTGLTEAARHGSIAFEEGGDFPGVQPDQDAVPFAENRADFAAVASHPSSEVLAGDSQRAPVAPKSRGNQAVLRRVDVVDNGMRHP